MPDKEAGKKSGQPGARTTSYRIGELAVLAGVSTKTLRYYESQGLLHPKRTASGYRIFSERDAKRLGQILAMRACGLPLATIKALVEDSGLTLHEALEEHLRALEEQQEQVAQAMYKTKQALSALERIQEMSAKETFEEIKRQAIEENEKTYGREARERYGDATVDESNRRMAGFSKEQWDGFKELEVAIIAQLKVAAETGDATSEAARELALMHQRWIRTAWGEGSYTTEMHKALADGYLADTRFKDYYDGAAGEGATEFLVAAIKANL